MWLKAKGFFEKVHSWWDSYNFQGSPSYRIAKKLRALKVDLKKWNEEDFGHVEEKNNSLWMSLNDLDSLEETHPMLRNWKRNTSQASWKRQLFWRKSVGGKNLEFSILKRVIEIQNSSIELQICTKGSTP